MTADSIHIETPPWLNPLGKGLKRAAEGSNRVHLLLLFVLNLVGNALLLSPLLAGAGAVALALSLSQQISGPLDWFVVEVLCAFSLFSGYLTLQLFKIRSRTADGLPLQRAQAPDLYAMLERRIARFRAGRVDRVVLTTRAELRIETTPCWPLPQRHNATLHIGAPLLFFLSPAQFRLALAGAVTQQAFKHRSLSGWLTQCIQDWNSIHTTLSGQNSLYTRLLRQPALWIAYLMQMIGTDLQGECQQRQNRWIRQNSDEETLIKYLSNCVVAHEFLDRQYWPMIYKAAERSSKPVVRPFSHFELLVERILNPQAAKRWLLQAQAASSDSSLDLREQLADLGLDHLSWNQLPEQSAFKVFFDSNQALKQLDQYWQQRIEPEWDRRHAAFQKDLKRFQQLQENAKQRKLRGSSALNYIQLAVRFLEPEQHAAVLEEVYQSNLDDAAVCFACGQELLDTDHAAQGMTALEHAAELDATLANRAHALINQSKRNFFKERKKSA